jgi:hypothetical protein
MFAPALMKGVGAAASAVTAPVATAIRSLRQPAVEAARRAQLAMAKDRALGQGLTPQQSQAAATQSQPTANIDLGGETTRALARSATNTSPEARDILNRTINDRFETQGDRVSGFVRKLVGVSGDASATRDVLATQARKANRPAYLAAYRAGNRSLQSPELERLMQAPEVQGALSAALKRGRSRAVAERMPWNPTQRTLQIWDYTKRELDSMAGVAARAGDKGRAQVLSTLARDLRDELDRLIPEFKPARGGAAQYFGAEDALEAGQKFVNMTVDVGAARRAILKMSTAERQLFGEGFASALIDKVSRARDRVNVVNTIYGSPKARQQIETALGSAKAKELEAFMRIEALMDLARGAVQGNSTTARQLAELGLAGGAGFAISGGNMFDPSAWLTALAIYGSRRGLGKIDQRVATHVGKLLASNDPQALSRGVSFFTARPQMMELLRSATNIAAGVIAGQQGARGGAMPSPARAETEGAYEGALVP